MEEVKVGCGISAEPIEEKTGTSITKDQVKNTIKEEISMIKVGKPAPNFKAQAFYQGKFVNVNLADFIGKWVYLCFYPGDFTFV